ncbi:hypothetical protein [Pelodictyon luteolum]|uniref:TPR repeat n=1 Tax=Chlorobium luteolum (strain DSM 273 / BCRC 81028 / 2530) TaxID=319225 RepID=Q3B5X4_CHLL3|nr:hypothetical protein [Pelodictyon luteolum]ABB23257.1 TPR repeat [Pelodictyon luteolum DSM 273]
MKSIVARAALGACILALPAGLDAGTDAPLKTVGDAELTLRELIEQAEENISEADLLIEARKQAERNAESAAKVREAYERGSRLAESGDLAGARAEWRRALEIARNPEMKSYIVEQTRKAEQRAEAQRAEREQRVAALNGEATALFGRGLLDESQARFQESLALEASNPEAKRYIDTLIPARRNELRQQAAREEQARVALEKGRALSSGGDFNAALTRWREALALTSDVELAATINNEIQLAEGKVSKAAGLLSEGAVQFDAGSLQAAEEKFRAALAVDPMQVAATDYLEVKIPARKVELQRIAEAEAGARVIFEKGNKLFAAGDTDGAKAAWREAEAATRDPELKAAVVAQFRKAEAQEAAERAAAEARVAALVREGESLFQSGRLEEAEAKFREVIALDRSDRVATQYLSSSIPDRKAQLEKQREEEAEARAAIERGNKLYAGGNLDGAQAVWREALSLTRNPELKSAIALQSRRAEEQAARDRAALKARIDSLSAEGVALFNADRLDEAALKFRGVLALDPSHWSSLQSIDSGIPKRRKELERIAVVEEQAAGVALRGDALLKAGDLEGAKSAYLEAAGIAEKAESKASMTLKADQITLRQEREAEELRARIAAMATEGESLFNADRLDESTAKFRELLTLDATNRTATTYINDTIPARKAELERRAAVAKQARASYERGTSLAAAGDLRGAVGAWNEALAAAEDPDLTAAINTGLAGAKEKLARAEELTLEGTALFQSGNVDGSEATFRQALALDPMNRGAMDYLEVRLPVRRAELQRQREAEELRGRIAATLAEGESLFNTDRLDESTAKFKELLALDATNRTATGYINDTIPARKKELQRIAAVEQRVKETGVRGDGLLKAGDLEGAKAAYLEAAGIAEKAESKASMTQKASQITLRQEREAEELRARIAAMATEGESLFNADRLDESAAKFSELLALDATNRTATGYINDTIPARKAELEHRAAVAEQARASYERGSALAAAGDLRGAVGAWNEALAAAEDPKLTAAIKTGLAGAKEKLARAEALSQEGTALFQSGNVDGSEAKFRSALIIDPMNRGAMDYLEVRLPARRAELQRQREAEELRVRIAATLAEGESLFNADRLDESTAKFRELLALDATNRTATGYINDTIPARKAELERRAAVAKQARASYERGTSLAAAGDLRGAVGAWNEALAAAEDPELTAAINTGLAGAKEKLAKAEELTLEGTALFQSGNVDGSEAKFRSALILDPMNPVAMDYRDAQIPLRREELRRQIEAEAQAAAAFKSGNTMFAAGDLNGAEVAWRKALSLTRNPELQAAIALQSRKAEEQAAAERAALAARIEALGREARLLLAADQLDEADARYRELLALDPARPDALLALETGIPQRRAELKRQREAEELRARIAAISAEGESLFNADRLDESTAKFSELLALDATNRTATGYINDTIPARKAELERRAAVAEQARASYERGSALAAAGDLRGAVGAWNEALAAAEDPELTAAINTGLAGAKEKLARAEELTLEGTALFQSGNVDGSETTFRQVLALDPMNRGAMDYLEVQLPARRAELLRQQREAEHQARIAAISAEGESLFNADRLGESAAKFRELLALDATNRTATGYINDAIPARRVELQRRAAVARQAQAGYENGRARYAAGDLAGAIGAWEGALRIAEDAKLTATINADLQKAREKSSRIRALHDESLSLFASDSLDGSEAKFRELLAIDASNAVAKDHLSSRIPARRAELLRQRGVASSVEAALGEGNRLYASGNVQGAIARWTEGLGVAETPGQKASLAGQVRMADERLRQEAAARQIRVSELYAEGATLFGSDRLDEAAAKFQELLQLDGSHPEARSYAGVKIPARKAELQRLAELEQRAKDAYERGNRLYAAGDYDAAKAAWQEALNITATQR